VGKCAGVNLTDRFRRISVRYGQQSNDADLLSVAFSTPSTRKWEACLPCNIGRFYLVPDRRAAYPPRNGAARPTRVAPRNQAVLVPNVHLGDIS
jgi:hypothetical protein